MSFLDVDGEICGIVSTSQIQSYLGLRHNLSHEIKAFIHKLRKKSNSVQSGQSMLFKKKQRIHCEEKLQLQNKKVKRLSYMYTSEVAD